MKSVTISELKARLSRYLRQVLRGTEITVVHRGTPVARLTGLGAGDASQDALRKRLIETGMIRPREKKGRDMLKLHPLPLKGVDLTTALNDDRKDRA